MRRHLCSPIILILALCGAGPAAADGEAVYNQACKMCHDSGMMGAPRLGEADAWAARLEKGEQALLQNVINGMGAMPKRGGCPDCSDQELAAAIDYLRENASR